MYKSYFFKKSGYSVISVFTKNEINDISTIIEKRLNLITRKKMFSDNIRKLHKIEIDDNSYKEIIKSETRYINIGKKKLRKVEKNTELTNILNSFWDHSKIKVIWVGDPKKKELKMRKDSSTIISDILGNTQSIGTEEFSTYNMTKLINYARAEGLTTLEDDLLLYKQMQRSQKRVNDIAMEGAKLVRGPIDMIKESIESMPGGKFISKLLGLEDMADSIEEKFLSGFRKKIGLEKEKGAEDAELPTEEEVNGVVGVEKKMDWNEFHSRRAKSTPGLDPSERASAYEDYKTVDVSGIDDIEKQILVDSKTQTDAMTHNGSIFTRISNLSELATAKRGVSR